MWILCKTFDANFIWAFTTDQCNHGQWSDGCQEQLRFFTNWASHWAFEQFAYRMHPNRKYSRQGRHQTHRFRFVASKQVWRNRWTQEVYSVSTERGHCVICCWDLAAKQLILSILRAVYMLVLLHVHARVDVRYGTNSVLLPDKVANYSCYSFPTLPPPRSRALASTMTSSVPFSPIA